MCAAHTSLSLSACLLPFRLAPLTRLALAGAADCHPYTDVHALERQVRAVQAALPAGHAIIVSTKSGMKRISDESNGWRPGSTAPGSVRKAIVEAQQALCARGAPLFLWSLHHADGYSKPGALEAALEEAKACVAEGLLRHIGLCNATQSLLERALAVTPILCVQNEYSLYCREAEQVRPPTAAASSKKGVLRLCAARGVTFVAHSPLGGLKARRGERSLAREYPKLASLAAKHGVSPQAACLAALLHRGRTLGASIIVIPGARTAVHAADSCAAAALQLSDAEVDDVMGPVVR